jgi:hypothetical protein
METTSQQSKAPLWIGRVLSGICIIFLLIDSVPKIVQAAFSVEGSAQIGWPADLLKPIGYILLASTLIYSIPRTAILGAILLTGYLGGAVAVMLRAGLPGHPFYFPVIFGILIWAGLYLRDEKLRAMFQLRR